MFICPAVYTIRRWFWESWGPFGRSQILRVTYLRDIALFLYFYYSIRYIFHILLESIFIHDLKSLHSVWCTIILFKITGYFLHFRIYLSESLHLRALPQNSDPHPPWGEEGVWVKIFWLFLALEEGVWGVVSSLTEVNFSKKFDQMANFIENVILKIWTIFR